MLQYFRAVAEDRLVFAVQVGLHDGAGRLEIVRLGLRRTDRDRGDYGRRAGDNPATIGGVEQQARAVQASSWVLDAGG